MAGYTRQSTSSIINGANITAPPLNIIRRYLPNFGTIVISPVILIFLLYFLRNLVFEFFGYY